MVVMWFEESQMRFCLVILSFFFAQPVQADELSPWQNKANEIILTYKRITHVTWISPSVVYVWTDSSTVHWWTILDQHVCKIGLDRERTDRPEGQDVGILVRNNANEAIIQSYLCR